MAIPWTLLFYIARSFILHIALITTSIGTVCFLFAFAENFRRVSSKTDDTINIAFKMSLFNTPTVIELILPFIFLVAAMSCCFSMTRNNELNAARTGGISALIFIQPLIIIALISGVLVFSIYNPLSTSLNTEYSKISTFYIKGKPNLLALSDTGIWLKQGDSNKNSIVHVLHVDTQGFNFSGVTIFLYEKQNHLIGRLDAKKARLQEGEWDLDDVWITKTDGTSHFVKNYKQPTDLTNERVYDSVAPADTISFWALRRFINLAKTAGLSVGIHEFQWHSLVALPFFLAAIVLFGASLTFFFSMRQGKGVLLIVYGLAFGFAVYTLSFLGRKIAVSEGAPIIFLTWAPIIISFCVGSFIFLQKEEG